MPSDDKAQRLEIFYKKYRSIEEDKLKKEQADVDSQGVHLFNKNVDLINKFFEIAYRKVTTVDQYGDENWAAFEKELLTIICKIADREGLSQTHIKDLKKGEGNYWAASKGFESLKKLIKQEFRNYYDKEKTMRVAPNKIDKLSGVEFENYLMNLFRKAGYDVKGTPITGDQGADMIVVREGKKIAIQAKKYSSSVGNKAIQEVVSARTFYGCDEAWVITNAQYTKSAIDLFQKCHVKLIDGYALNQLQESLFVSPTSAENSSSQITKIVLCPKCSQKLRVPANKKLLITCTNCRHKFRETT